MSRRSRVVPRPVVDNVIVTMGSCVGAKSGDGHVEIFENSVEYDGDTVDYGGNLDELKKPQEDYKLYRTLEGWTMKVGLTTYNIHDDSRQLWEKYDHEGYFVSRSMHAWFDLTVSPPRQNVITEKFLIPWSDELEFDIDDAYDYNDHIWVLPSTNSGEIFMKFGLDKYVILAKPHLLMIPKRVDPNKVYIYERMSYRTISFTLEEVDEIEMEHRPIDYADDLKSQELFMHLMLNYARYLVKKRLEEVPQGLTLEQARSNFEALKSQYSGQAGFHQPLTNALRILSILSVQPIPHEASELVETKRIAIHSSRLKGYKKYARCKEIISVEQSVDEIDVEAPQNLPYLLVGRQKGRDIRKKANQATLSNEEFDEQLILFLQMNSELFAENNAVIMGSAAAYLLFTHEGKKRDKEGSIQLPNDVDIWFYDKDVIDGNGTYVPAYRREKMMRQLTKEHWEVEDFTRPFSSKISPNIRSITQMWHPSYAFKLQFIGIMVDPHAMTNEFDLSVAKVIYNPKTLPGTDSIIGFRQTDPAVIEDVFNRRAVFLERLWDLETPSAGSALQLTKRAISRLVKYERKGFTITASPESKFSTNELYAAMNAFSVQTQDETEKEYEGFYYIEFPEKFAEPLSELISLIYTDLMPTELVFGGTDGKKEVIIRNHTNEHFFYLKTHFEDFIYGSKLGLSVIFPNRELGQRSEWQQPVLRSNTEDIL